MSQDTYGVATLQSPKKRLPPGACDTHAHVFGPYDRFPLAEPRPYTPMASPFDHYWAMLKATGFDRGVLVHGGAHGWDHSAMLDAIARAPDRLRGIGVVPADEETGELGRLHTAGIRGLRFTDVAGPNASQNFAGRVGLDGLYALAPKMRDLGWHAVIWANSSVFETHANKLRTLGIPIVIDHLGYFDVTKGVDDSAFRAVRNLVEDGIAYIKLTAFRNSKQPPLHEDVEPYHKALVRANPERILWGSDWPFLGMNTYRPEPGAMLDLMDRWIEDDDIKELALVTNPERLYFST